jgi:hypothetical protein
MTIQIDDAWKEKYRAVEQASEIIEDLAEGLTELWEKVADEVASAGSIDDGYCQVVGSMVAFHLMGLGFQNAGKRLTEATVALVAESKRISTAAAEQQ